MKKDNLFILLAIVFMTAALIWFVYQNQIAPSTALLQPEEVTLMFEKEYDAQPYTGKKVILTKEEWEKRLTPEEFYVMREHGTEKAGSGKYDKLKEQGVYNCAACGLSLFSSDAKYDSGSGWPSFSAPINSSHVGYQLDKSLFSTRVEVHCNRCESHLGHVFNDGPPPTGHRYCINSVALEFVPEKPE